MKYFSSRTQLMKFSWVILDNGSKLSLQWSCRKSLRRRYSRGIPFQDVAKAGLQFGDEGKKHNHFYSVCYSWCIGLDAEEEKEQQKDLDEKFKPLLDWLKLKAKDIVRNGELILMLFKFMLNLLPVVLSNRLVKSPCAIVANIDGYTANVQKILSA